MKKTALLLILGFATTASFSQEYTLENLGGNVNSADGDNGPVISPDGKTIYFWSTRGGATSYYAEIDEQGKCGPAMPLEEPFRSINAKVCAISPDGNRLLVNYYKSSRSTFAFSNKTKSGWGPLEELQIEGYPATTDDNYFTKATLSADGKTIVFVMTDPLNPKSKYRSDLVAIFLKSDNTWTKPLNLGPKINFMESEIAPFLASDNKTLYFSRNTEENSNNFDIYKTTRLDETWTNWSDVSKLGSNINDERWNADYVIPASGNYAYLASSKNPLQGTYTDLVRIKLRDDEKPNPVVLISGKVLDTKTQQPIDAKIVYENLETGAYIGSATTNPQTGVYKIILPYGINYGMTAVAQNYISISDNLNLKSVAAYQELDKNLNMTPIEVGQTIRINNLFFETGKSVIKSESFPELERLVKFMQENPNVKIQINGHTDNQGSLDLNQKLSEERAKAVKKYLLDKQITDVRIITKGFGPNKPVAKNDTEEGRQLNRRVEFQILSK